MSDMSLTLTNISKKRVLEILELDEPRSPSYYGDLFFRKKRELETRLDKSLDIWWNRILSLDLNKLTLEELIDIPTDSITPEKEWSGFTDLVATFYKKKVVQDIRDELMGIIKDALDIEGGVEA